MERLPDQFTKAFVNEGVVHAICHLAFPELECELAGIRRSPRMESPGQPAENQNLSAKRREAMTRARTFFNTHFANFKPHEDTTGTMCIKGITQKLHHSDQSQAAIVDLLRIINEDGDSIVDSYPGFT